MVSRWQWGGALVAVLATLALLSLPGTTARADTPSGYDQMTGTGQTASGITVKWTQGLLDNTNTAITSANADRSSSSPTSPYAFMYNDFKNLQVTVSQTQDLGHQGITVSWSGGLPTVGIGTLQGNFLQMMECWGDVTTGPAPEDCEYGSSGLLSGNNAFIGQRHGQLCATTSPSTSNPPSVAGGNGGPSAGCDPQEPTDLSHVAPGCASCSASDFSIPFSPVTDPTAPVYGEGANDTTWYDQFNTDEVQEAVTNPDGTGQQQFETLTGVQAPGLGCGEADNNAPRGCWLVIVPRGQYEPNGYQINPNNSNSFINTTPLSASAWAQRIQIHLSFDPAGSFCPIGTLERQTFGTQLVARAMQSWQLALNQQANCTKIYGYSSVFEATSTQNLQAGGDSGLAFTTIPIGSEAARDGNTPPTNLPPIVYAPVAITALDFGFDINLLTGYYSTPVKLTPLLLTKALTQSYLSDLPDYYPEQGSAGPSWAQANPLNISQDPTFEALNPGTRFALTANPIAPLLTEDHSALNQQIWQWVQGSSAAKTWLSGTPDANDGNMKIDPDYETAGSNGASLGTAPAIDSFPRAYKGNYTACEAKATPPSSPSASPSPSTSSTPACPAGQQMETKTSIDLLPYTDNYDSAAADILTGNDPNTGAWAPQATAPDGSTGWWSKNPPEPIGQRFVWAADDTSDLAAYGVVPAQLCDDNGANCVSPTETSVGAAVTAATPDSSGLLQVNPASPGNGGYPLTQIIYAAVPTNQSAAALTDYANLIAFAAGNGQATGSAPGDLPPGYLPLPSDLQTQAQAVVTQLRTLATASPSPSTSSSSSSQSSSSQSSSSTSTSATTTTTTPGTTAAGTSPAGSTGSTAGPTPTPAPAAAPTSPARATTPAAALGKNTTISTPPTVARSGSTSPAGAIGYLPPAEAVGGEVPTPHQALGAIRWALIAVAGAGGVFAIGGTLLRSGGIPTPPWRRRRMEWLE